jgi:O-antigen/teichoic acid export membrane protein
VPFTVRFAALGADERLLYFATLAAAGAAAMLLIAPSSHHRVLFRCGDKQHVVRMAHRYAVLGLGCVAIAMVGALVLVAHVVFGGLFATVAGVVAGLACAWCWYGQPLRRRKELYARRPARLRAADDRGSPAAS